MVRRILSAIMGLQLLALLLFWYLAAQLFALDVALLAALLGVLLVRLAITASNFRLSHRARSPLPAQHRLDWIGRLHLFFEEYGATMLASSWTMLRHRPQMHLASQPCALPVLLVHGYGCNGGYWTQLAEVLRRERVSHLALDLEPVAADIDDFVPLLEEAAQRLLQASGAPRLVVVAHSMGGLVTRAWLRQHGAARVARVVTLGTPHHGTALATLGVGSNARQMRRGSEWLARLAASEDAARRALFTSIWSHHDNIIAPQDSSLLPGARNIEFGGIGHVALGRHPQVQCRVLAEILAASGTAAGQCGAPDSAAALR
ncbi:triacylglycerol lipase [Massilia sp. BJB1822]|uniref:esterase/lipase family protein n=1 Tax=Massilia sp. BJB1822 TaxID=2744470 RepID=UPI001593FB69|nr:alpha/beta fold hydrolase [Massilia sp. BJB1822]NVE00524.1 alpha/beta fold hydrolase [Massilia sp. BJB1822]